MVILMNKSPFHFPPIYNQMKSGKNDIVLLFLIFPSHLDFAFLCQCLPSKNSHSIEYIIVISKC